MYRDKTAITATIVKEQILLKQQPFPRSNQVLYLKLEGS